jgi:short-subunit dehydrogenase
LAWHPVLKTFFNEYLFHINNSQLKTTTMKTVLITGTSSGIGQQAAITFAKAGWEVAATMRNPEKDSVLSGLANVKLYAMDVDNAQSVDKVMAQVVTEYGRLDCVINNAGYGLDGVFEAMSDEVIYKQFNTNVFGLMRVTRAAVKIFREQKSGTIIQIASMGGRLAFPLFSIYHGTKWAVEGFSESLAYELRQFNIKVRIIEPGAIKTAFYGSSRKFVKPDYTNAYDNFLATAEKVGADAGKNGDSAEKVAQTILKAATDNSNKLRYPVGNPAPLLLTLRKLIPESWFFGIVRNTYKL